MLIVKGLRTKRLLDLNHCVASSHKLDIWLKYMGNSTIELELVINANCINFRSQNFKRYRENSSRLKLLEFSKNLHSVIYEALGSHSHGFSIFLEDSSRLELSENS